MKPRSLGRTLNRLGLVLLLFLGAFKGAEWLSDAWWNTALGQGDTYALIFRCRVTAFLCAASVWGAIWASNVRLAWFYIEGRAQALELLGPGRRSDFYSLTRRPERGLAQARRLSTNLAFALLVWLAGSAAANSFDLWLPLANLAPVGQSDPVSGRDLSFFFWVLPALQWTWSFFGFALLATTIACVSLYSSAGLIETGPQMFRVAPRAAWHLLTLGAILVLWQGVHQGLEILAAPIADGWRINSIFGAPEAHFMVPTRFLFLLTCLPVAGAILLLSRRDRLNTASGLWCGWMVAALVLPWLAAPFGRSLRTNDTAEEQLAIERHIKATQVAWGIDGAAQRTLAVPTQCVEASDVEAPLTNTNVASTPVGVHQDFGQFPLWPAPVVQHILEVQDTNSARQLGALHLEVSGGRLVYRALAANPSAANDFPAVVYEADAASVQPPTPRRIPIRSLLIGEAPNSDDDSRAGNEPSDPSYGGPLPSTAAALPRWRSTENADFAVERDTLWQRLALALRFFNFSLLGPGDAVTWRLDAVSRAQALLPVVDWSDTQARPVVVGTGRDAHLYWLLNGWFTSNSYPNAAMLQITGTQRRINYLRETVLGVVDATTGETSFYALDPNEPLARGWMRALPGAFSELASLPPVLRAQIQPSAGRLEAVATIWSRYHSATNGNPAQEWIQGDQIQGEQSWRPVFTKANEAIWNPVLPSGDGRLWFSCPFATATGRADDNSLVSILGIPGGMSAPVASPSSNASPPYAPTSDWVEWRPREPLDVPDFAGPDSWRVTGRQYVPPAPSLTTIFPRLGGQSDPIEGLLLARGALADASVTGATTATRPPAPSPTGESAGPRRFETPKIEVRYALWGTSRPVQAPREEESLARVRVLWSLLLQARRTQSWTDVARIESELSRILGPTPDSASTSGPYPQTAPYPRLERGGLGRDR